MRTVVQNGLVVSEDFGAFLPLDIVISDGVIESLVARGAEVAGVDQTIDATGAYVLPGLIDIHVHGGMGVHFATDPDFSPALRFCAREGVTTVLPTLATRPIGDMLRSIETVFSEAERACGARIGGIHLEGPFVSAKKKGAMMMPTDACSVDNFDALYDGARGMLRVMTIAPEREGALSVIERGAALDVRMSVGHTEASVEQTLSAIACGARGATHTFNAMGAFSHRAPGAVGALLTHPAVTCEVIADMVHLAPETVKLILLAKGTDGTVLISDSGKIAGLGDGDYLVDGQIRYVRGGVSRHENGTIAGSSYTMADGARRLLEIGCSLLDIAKMGARNPAHATGLWDRGVIGVGKLADLLITDESLNIREVVLRGRMYREDV